ncbi:MAG: glycosyltransferase family 2 protein [Bacteroidota bacterium]
MSLTTEKIPLVSVLLPTYNRSHLVCRAIDSALNQTYPRIEIIVVDDGSTDATREVLTKYGDRIRYHHQQNAGLSTSRNTAIKHSRGDFLALLDDDDEWRPSKIQKQVERFLSNPELGFTYTRGVRLRPDGSTEDAITANKLPKNDLVSLFRYQNTIPASSVMIRHSVLEKTGVFNSKLLSIEDYDLWLRIAAGAPFDCIEEDLTILHVGHPRLTSNHLRMFTTLVEVIKSNGENNAILKPYLNGRLAWIYLFYGRTFLQLEDVELARTNLRMAIRYRFWDLKPYFFYLLSFLGKHNRTALRKLKNNPGTTTLINPGN